MLELLGHHSVALVIYDLLLGSCLGVLDLNNVGPLAPLLPLLDVVSVNVVQRSGSPLATLLHFTDHLEALSVKRRFEVERNISFVLLCGLTLEGRVLLCFLHRFAHQVVDVGDALGTHVVLVTTGAQCSLVVDLHLGLLELSVHIFFPLALDLGADVL